MRRSVTRLDDFKEVGQFEKEWGVARGALGVILGRRDERQCNKGHQRSKVTNQVREQVRSKFCV